MERDTGDVVLSNALLGIPSGGALPSGDSPVSPDAHTQTPPYSHTEHLSGQRETVILTAKTVYYFGTMVRIR